MSGHVTDPGTGQPLNGACVIIGPVVPCAPNFPHTDATGLYTVDLPAVTLGWTFNFQNCDYATQLKSRTISANTTLDAALVRNAPAKPAPLGGTPTDAVYLPNITKTLGGPNGYDTPFIAQHVGTGATQLEVSHFRFSDGCLITRRTVNGLAAGTSFADIPSTGAMITLYGPYAAKGADGVNRFSPIVVQNVGTSAVAPSLAFTPLGGGAAQMFTGPSVAPGGAWAFDPRFTLGTTTPCTAQSSTCLGNGSYSVVISAPGGLIAAVILPVSDATAMAYTAAPTATSRQYLPNVTRTLGGPSGYTTPIVLQSAGATGATLRWFRFSDGLARDDDHPHPADRRRGRDRPALGERPFR